MNAIIHSTAIIGLLFDAEFQLVAVTVVYETVNVTLKYLNNRFAIAKIISVALLLYSGLSLALPESECKQWRI